MIVPKRNSFMAASHSSQFRFCKMVRPVSNGIQPLFLVQPLIVDRVPVANLAIFEPKLDFMLRALSRVAR